MTEETPATPGPSADEPVTAAPPAAETPADPATPAVPPTPAAETPAAAAVSDAAPAPAAAAPAPGSEAPTEPAPAPAAEPPTQVAEAPAAAAAASEPGAPVPPAAAPPAPSAPRERGRGVFVPAWVAAVVAVLVVAALGFLVGWIAAPGDNSSPTNASASAPNGQQAPTFPTVPGNGNGSTGNGGSSGSGGQTAPSQSGAFMGIAVESATDGGTGARINSVQAGSPAAKAGLQEGDVITKIDGDTVQSSLDVVRAVRSHDPGDTLTVTYTRNGNTAEAKVTLGSASSSSSSN